MRIVGTRISVLPENRGEGLRRGWWVLQVSILSLVQTRSVCESGVRAKGGGHPGRSYYQGRSEKIAAIDLPHRCEVAVGIGRYVGPVLDHCARAVGIQLFY